MLRVLCVLALAARVSVDGEPSARLTRVGGPVLCQPRFRPPREAAYLNELLGGWTCATQHDVYVASVVPRYTSQEYPLERQLDEAARGGARVLVLLADETCAWGRAAWDSFGNFSLVLRQYGCGRAYASQYAEHPHVVQLALSYGRLFRASLPVAAATRAGLLRADARAYAWSMPGTMKTDRKLAVDTFVEAGLGAHAWGRMSKKATVAATRDSRLVLSGSGNYNRDCGRNYESMILGAVPVMVGSARDAADDHSRYCVASMPPFLYGADWRDAADRARVLLADAVAMRARQLAAVDWWVAELRCTMARIDRATR